MPNNGYVFTKGGSDVRGTMPERAIGRVQRGKGTAAEKQEEEKSGNADEQDTSLFSWFGRRRSRAGYSCKRHYGDCWRHHDGWQIFLFIILF